MNSHPSLEARIGALISAYAERAPTDVDPLAMTRLAAADQARPRLSWSGSVSGFAIAPQARWLAFGVVLLALLVTLVGGAFIAGAQPVQDPEDLLTSRTFVAPFTGLPPEGTPPSDAPSGELVVGFGARIPDLGFEHYRMWLYADGRLIWTSEGGAGGRTLANAVVEQRLTPEGVELVRSEVAANVVRVLGPTSVGEDRIAWGRAGVLWGSMTVGDGDGLLDVEWGGHLAGALVDPASWLPESAWADARIRAYVPARYAVCAWMDGADAMRGSDRAVEQLPAPVRTLVLGAGAPMAGQPFCHEVSADTARAIVANLDAAGIRHDERTVGPHFELSTDGIPPPQVTIDVMPITPHGQIVCNCG